MIAETKYGKAVAFLRSGFFAFGLLLSAVWEGPAAAQDNEEAALSREEIVQLVVLANLEFTLLHEIGHALIDHFELPVFGREEDAADQIATTTMILRNNADVDAYAIDRLLAVSGRAHMPSGTVIPFPFSAFTISTVFSTGLTRMN